MRFRVGDIIRGKKDGTTNEFMTKGEVIKILNPERLGGADMVVRILEYPFEDEIGKEFHVCSEHFELVECKGKKIEIYQEDNKVIALDKSTGKRSIATCSPEDEFDFYTGAKIAFGMLVEESKPKLLNVDICITETSADCLTVGKIYKIRDGKFKDNYGCWYPHINPLVDIEDLKRYFSGKRCRKYGRSGSFSITEFVEVVE